MTLAPMTQVSHITDLRKYIVSTVYPNNNYGTQYTASDQERWVLMPNHLSLFLLLGASLI